VLGRFLPAIALLAVLTAALSARADYAAEQEVERLGTALGDFDLGRQTCPALAVEGAAVQAEIQRLGGERLNADAVFQRAIRQRLMTGQQDLRKEGPVEYCEGLLKRYGPEGTVLKGVIKKK